MKLPQLADLDLVGKKVLLRADLDFEPDEKNFRFLALIPTLDFLSKKAGEIILLGHRGRPGGKDVPELSLKPFGKLFSRWQNLSLEENLRFSPGEESNDPGFGQELAKKGEIYVNEAFAASHREHASIVGLPKLLPHAAGLHLIEEVDHLSRVFNDPQKPVLILISGLKKDKLKYLEPFKKFADKILVAGRLPEYLAEDFSDPKIRVGRLIQDKEDLTLHSIEEFETEIKRAGTILTSGPMGKFEEEGHRQGTEKVLKAIAQTSAFKVAGGGETLEAIKILGLEKKFDWLSVGGGAMLEFLAKGTLPGLEALLN